MKEVSVRILLLISILFSTGNVMSERKDYTREEYNFMSDCVDEIVNIFEKEMKERFSLICIGQGGSMPYDIQSLRVDFLVKRQTSIEEARELEVRATERFVELVNAHEKVRPYLRDYPWDYNRARVMISCYQEDGKDYPEGIRLILQGKGNVFYFGPKKTPNEVGITIKEESYEEAKKIVDSSPSCLKPVQKKKKWFGWL